MGGVGIATVVEARFAELSQGDRWRCDFVD